VKFDTLIRFSYIETRLYWEGGFTAGSLAKAVGITRQTAQAVIEEYRQKHPDQMRYDESLKRHVATDDFEPQYIRANTILFLEYLRGQNFREHYLDDESWSDTSVEDADQLLRPNLARNIVQPILAALRHKQTLWIEYHPVMEEEIRARIISPNHLVFANNRYHLHAYCHNTHSYRDFVLSRIIAVEPAQEEWVSAAGSEEWQKHVILRYKPNPELPLEVQKTLLRGYPGSDQGIWEIRCRKNFEYYIRSKVEKAFDKARNVPKWIEVNE
jgi:DNA-binding XRE family transcriptional regulator